MTVCRNTHDKEVKYWKWYNKNHLFYFSTEWLSLPNHWLRMLVSKESYRNTTFLYNIVFLIELQGYCFMEKKT